MKRLGMILVLAALASAAGVAQQAFDEQEFLASMQGTWIGHKTWELTGVMPGDLFEELDEYDSEPIVVGSPSPFEQSSADRWEFEFLEPGRGTVSMMAGNIVLRKSDASVVVRHSADLGAILILFRLEDSRVPGDEVVLSIEESSVVETGWLDSVANILGGRGGRGYVRQEVLVLQSVE